MSLQIFITDLFCLPAVLDVGGASISIRKPLMGNTVGQAVGFFSSQRGTKSHQGREGAGRGVGGWGSSREPVMRQTSS